MRNLITLCVTVATLAVVLCLAGCQGGKTARVYAVYTGGNPHRGKELIREYRCGSCHMIPGIRTATGLVGPPLLLFGRRTYIAGEVPNNPENLIRWLKSPPSIEPGTAMPDLGLSEDQARDIAAYLYTLR